LSGSIVVALVASRAGAGSPPERPVARTTYVVQAGDTLWGIASRLAGPAGDPRPLVVRLARANHTEGDLIRVGQLLVLPQS
jgi:nucleoid-associated protein YgaU